MNTESFVKMLLHGAKYPHCAVNGLFVQKKTKSKNNQNENGGSPAIQIVDCIPLFHINMTLLPMLELALHQIEAYCKEENLAICGYYHMHSNLRDEKPDAFIYKLMERLEENSDGKTLLFMVDNNKLGFEEEGPPPFTVYEFRDGKLVTCNSSMKVEESAVETAITAIEDKKHYQLVDFDNHLDNISLDWRNLSILS